ncbi:MAG TPA: YtxH domain-containing protein [Bacteroidota bacterium]|nr:YtxH domain-containing protein [Bacteroidota bacterium]
MSDNTTRNLLIGFLSGAVVGGVIALLYAPKPGKELRSDLKRKGGELAEDIEEYLQEAQDKARTLINEGKEKSSALITDAKRKADSLLQDAEHILSDARSRVSEEGSRLKTAVKAGIDTYKQEVEKPASDTQA